MNKVLNNIRANVISTIFIRKMSFTNIIVEKIGNITTVGINRPEKRNCVNFQTAKEIRNAIQEFEQDTTSTAAVLYGTGGNFSSGFDLNELSNLDDTKEANNLINNGLLGLDFVKKPVIAAISGYAVAGGLEIALMCDLRVMEETAVIGLYGRRFGIPIMDGATVRLQAMIGLSRALDLILTGRSLAAKEAFEWGVANRIVACGTALGQAINLASSLEKFNQNCLHIDKESTYNAAFQEAYKDLLKFERENTKKISKKIITDGARKFVLGLGRHGKTYNLTERNISKWEKEFNKESLDIQKKKAKTKSKL